MKPRSLTHLCIALIAMGLVVSAYAKKDADGENEKPKLKPMTVQINDAAVRTSPSFLAEVASVLGYGDKVGVAEQGEDWMRVEADGSGAAGWMHASALTKKKINLEAGDNDANVKASEEELTAGGRGYNQQIEQEFRKDNQELEPAYKQLDRMTMDQAWQASRADMIRFMNEGGLKGQAGGAR